MAKATTAGRNHGDPAPPIPDASRQRLTGPMRVVVGVVLLVLALGALREVASPDIGFHLKAGNHILDGNGWPRTDPFTYTVTDHAYIDTSWGYQVALAVVERVAARHAEVPVVLTGGVFQNDRLCGAVDRRLRERFEVLRHREVPPGDGGIALGQAVIADALLGERG